MKRSIIVGNWKMYLSSLAEASILTTTLRNELERLNNVEVILCPPSIWLPEMAQILGKGKVQLGAQNIYYEPAGSYTGEISPLMVKEMADYVIVGHSERREYFGESDGEINEKVISALRAGLKPIICVGENKKSADAEKPYDELKKAIAHVPRVHYKDLIIAYEPVWAISDGKSGHNATPQYVVKVIRKLRELVHFDTPILYGGSVRAANVETYADYPEIDGVLVGGASVRATEFIKICKTYSVSKRLVFKR